MTLSNSRAKACQTDVLFWASLHPNKRGSFEDYICHLASECVKDSIKIRFVLGDDISSVVRQLFKDNGVEYYPVRERDLNSVKALAGILKEARPRMVHFNFISPCSLLISACHLSGVRKLVLTDHSSSPVVSKRSISDALLHPIKKRRRQLWAGMISRFVAVSDFVAGRLKIDNGIHAGKVSVIYNGVNIERFSPCGEKDRLRQQLFNNEESRFVVSYVGALTPEKGAAVLLDAAAALLRGRQDVLFVITGQGSQTTVLQNRVRELQLNPNFLFLGKRDDVEAIFAASDIFVCPSVWGEAFGLSIAEAMACGLPTVASRIGGIPEVVEHLKTGILVTPNNSNELAAAISRLLADAGMRESFGMAGRKRAVENFSMGRMISETIGVYRGLL